MVVRVFISGNSSNIKVATNQHKVTGILDNLSIPYTTVDYTAKGNESDRKCFQKHSKKRPGQMVALAPQIFNDNDYCGDYADFDLANKGGTLEAFLKLSQNECLSKPPEKDPDPIRVEPFMMLQTEIDIGEESKAIDIQEIVAETPSYEQIEAFEKLRDDPDIECIKEIVISHLQIFDIPDSLQHAAKTEISIIHPLKKEIIQRSKSIPETSSNVSPRRDLKLDEKIEDPVVVPVRKSGHLLASVMQMIAIDNMYKY